MYIGDTARYPYGPRPADEVRRFAHELATSLVDDHDVKAIIVACNTAAASGLDSLRNEFSVPIIDVVAPGAAALVEATEAVGPAVIGTVGTVASGAYLRAVEHAAMVAGREVHLTSAACPASSSSSSAARRRGDEVTVLAERLLAPVKSADVDALLLGCTHYPFLSRVIGDVVGTHVTLVSSADETAFSAARLLGELGLLRAHHGRAWTASVPVQRGRSALPRARQAPARTRARRRRTVAPGTGCAVAVSWSRVKEHPNDACRRQSRRRAAPRDVRTRLHRDGRRLVPGDVRADEGAVHGERRRQRAAVDARLRQGLGDRRVLDASRLVARACRSRGGEGQAERAHRGDPAPHRTVVASSVRSDDSRRTSGRGRLRRAAGRRRHAHGKHLRRLPRPP